MLPCELVEWTFFNSLNVWRFDVRCTCTWHFFIYMRSRPNCWRPWTKHDRSQLNCCDIHPQRVNSALDSSNLSTFAQDIFSRIILRDKSCTYRGWIALPLVNPHFSREEPFQFNNQPIISSSLCLNSTTILQWSTYCFIIQIVQNLSITINLGESIFQRLVCILFFIAHFYYADYT